MTEAHNPYRVHDRVALTSKKRMLLWIAHKGVCCICDSKIAVGERWISEHIIPLWLNGTNDWENLGLAHEDCAAKKTSREAKDRAKGRRIAERHFGAKVAKGRPMPGTKRSGWKKKFDGTVERRRDE